MTIIMDEEIRTAESMYEFVRTRESRARTYADRFHRVFERGSGARLFDTEGREYLDCLAVAGTLALGHNHPYVAKAVGRFLESGAVQQALDLTTPAKHDFLKALYACLPTGFAEHARVQFCGPTGADAVEAALKLFKTATRRRAVFSFSGAYHGMTNGALALTGNLSAKREVAGLMADVHFLPYPYSYRCPFGIGPAGAQTSLEYINRLLSDPESGISKPAALIVEAVQGEGGVIPAPLDWLRGLREITAAHDVPMIVDEVQTGFGRTGHMFAFEAAGIEPDAVLLSKAIGGGYPLSVVLYHEKYDRWQAGAHAGTFRGNQMAMVAGTAVMEVLFEQDLVEAAKDKGEFLRAALTDLALKHPEVGDLRGRGLMWGLEIVDPRSERDARLGSRRADGVRARAIQQRCLDLGLILETGGRHGAVVRLLPPLIISFSELARVVSILDRALTETAA